MRLLLNAIKGRYQTEPAFDKLRVIAVDGEFRKECDYVKTIRNVTAFGLDEFGKTTRSVMADLPPTAYTIMAGDDRSVGYFNFDFSDYLDMAYLVDTFSKGHDWDQPAEDLMGSIAEKFLKACQ